MPAKVTQIAQSTPTKLNAAMAKPRTVMMRIGWMERLVMPSIARAIIFGSG